MEPIEWRNLDLCLVCSALVPRQLRPDHEAWHDRMAYELTRVTNRLDALRR